MRAELVVIERRHTGPKETEVTAFHFIDEGGHFRPAPRGLHDMAGGLPAQYGRLPIGPFQIDRLKKRADQDLILFSRHYDRQRLRGRQFLLGNLARGRLYCLTAEVQRKTKGGRQTMFDRIKPLTVITFQEKFRSSDRHPRRRDLLRSIIIPALEKST